MSGAPTELAAHLSPGLPKQFSMEQAHKYDNGDTFRGEQQAGTGSANGWGKYSFSAPAGSSEQSDLHATYTYVASQSPPQPPARAAVPAVPCHAVSLFAVQ